jgi:hypothetical protein
LAPCLGLLLLYISCNRRGEPFRWMRFSLASAAASLVPYLAFCSLRLAVVGHFGLVSFAGCTLAGLAVELLDTAAAQGELPEQYRPLAAAILQERERRGMQNAFQGGFKVNMRQFEDNYSTNLFSVAIPIAQRLYGGDLVVCNRELAGFARQVIRLRPGKYLLWAAWSVPRAAAKLVYRYWFLWIAVPLLALLFLARRMLDPPPCAAGAVPAYSDGGLLICMAWVAMLFFFANEGVQILSGVYGDSRYAVAAGAFVPPLLALFVLRELTLIRAAWLARCSARSGQTFLAAEDMELIKWRK